MDLSSYFASTPLAGFMLVVALGFALGRARWRGISLGPAGGTLLVALLAGALGLRLEQSFGGEGPHLTLGTFGFALFVYSIGFEAGPRLFDLLGDRKGWRLPMVGVLVNAIALAVAWACARLLALPEALAAGALAGALTSAPTYAAAAEVCADRSALAVTFALTFPVGLIGLVALTQVLPRWMGDDLLSLDDDEDQERMAHPSRPVLRRAFEVQKEAVLGRPLRELDLPGRTGIRLVQVHRGPEVRMPDADMVLEEGDHVMAEGRLDALRAFEREVGPEVYDEELRRRLPSPRAILVYREEAVGATLRELEVLRRNHCLVTEVQRDCVSLEPSAELRVLRDDVLLVVGRHDAVGRVARAVGDFERSGRETDLAVYAAGILLGVLLGSLSFEIAGERIGLGYAVGLLFSGVVLGRFRRIGRWNAQVPPAARQLVRDLGILLFVAETGVAAGASPLEPVTEHWPALLLMACLVAAAPVIGAVWLGRRWLHLRPVDAWGAMAGGMTSSSSLAVLRRVSDSSEPATAYAASYAVGAVLATLVGRWLLALL